jgi:hypothetical protein
MHPDIPPLCLMSATYHFSGKPSGKALSHLFFSGLFRGDREERDAMPIVV